MSGRTSSVQASLSPVMVTVCLTDLLASHPDVSIQVHNLGGNIPFEVERMDHRSLVDTPEEELPSSRFRRAKVFVDCNPFGPLAIEAAVGLYGADRIVCGTDGSALGVDWTRKALADARIGEEARGVDPAPECGGDDGTGREGGGGGKSCRLILVRSEFGWHRPDRAPVAGRAGRQAREHSPGSGRPMEKVRPGPDFQVSRKPQAGYRGQRWGLHGPMVRRLDPTALAPSCNPNAQSKVAFVPGHQAAPRQPGEGLSLAANPPAP
jgi:hypothetical protein